MVPPVQANMGRVKRQGDLHISCMHLGQAWRVMLCKLHSRAGLQTICWRQRCQIECVPMCTLHCDCSEHYKRQSMLTLRSNCSYPAWSRFSNASKRWTKSSHNGYNMYSDGHCGLLKTWMQQKGSCPVSDIWDNTWKTCLCSLMLSSSLISMTLLETEDDTLFSNLMGFWQKMLCDLMHLGDQHYHQHGTAWRFFNNRNMAKVALLLPILPNAFPLLAFENADLPSCDALQALNLMPYCLWRNQLPAWTCEIF